VFSLIFPPARGRHRMTPDSWYRWIISWVGSAETPEPGRATVDSLCKPHEWHDIKLQHIMHIYSWELAFLHPSCTPRPNHRPGVVGANFSLQPLHTAACPCLEPPEQQSCDVSSRDGTWPRTPRRSRGGAAASAGTRRPSPRPAPASAATSPAQSRAAAPGTLPPARRQCACWVSSHEPCGIMEAGGQRSNSVAFDLISASS
jgi:hypothetical protein